MISEKPSGHADAFVDTGIEEKKSQIQRSSLRAHAVDSLMQEDIDGYEATTCLASA